MKTIIAGSRTIVDYQALLDAVVDSNFDITEVVSGGARGVDKMGEVFAQNNNINLRVFPADWEKHGRKAGILRNIEMGDYADALIALWDGKSRGTKQMIEYATLKGLRVYVSVHKPTN